MQSDVSVCLNNVLACLGRIRTDVVTEEYLLQDLIANELTKAEIEFAKEYRLASHNRIDFLTSEGIGIEVKKGKPNRRQTVEQLKRYACFPQVNAIVLVVERSLTVPADINGKKCISLGLNRNWGIAL